MYTIDMQSRTPVFEQIILQTEEFVRAGILKPGDKLPSIRELTGMIGVNPNTIAKAYAELDRRGIAVSVTGKGFFIANNISEIMRSSAEKKLPEFEKLAKELIDSGIDRNKLIKIITDLTT
ncbi:MAG: GntR family transcriptional regulator [Clostridia bacterium]|nr:GntR family transcriptional regulator [Clostridia bacterium]